MLLLNILLEFLGREIRQETQTKSTNNTGKKEIQFYMCADDMVIYTAFTDFTEAVILIGKH